METEVKVTSNDENTDVDNAGRETSSSEVLSVQDATIATANAAVALAEQTTAEAELAASASVREFSETVNSRIKEFAAWQGECSTRIAAIETQLAGLTEGVNQALSILPSLIKEEVKEEVTETLQSTETPQEVSSPIVEQSPSSEGGESQEVKTERRRKFRWT